MWSWAEARTQDALVAALEQWSTAGIADNPGAWLMTTVRRRGVDCFRRADNLRCQTAELDHGAADEVFIQERAGVNEPGQR